MTEFSRDSKSGDDPVERVIFPPLDDGTPPPPELVDRVRDWLRHEPRGRQLMKHMMGEGPEPEPIFTAIQHDDGTKALMLGDGEVDVTAIEPLAEEVLPALFHQDDTQ